MPELPEVETVVRDLRPLLVGRTIETVWAGPAKLRRPWKRAWGGQVVGSTVAGVNRRGKWILLSLSPRGEGRGEGVRLRGGRLKVKPPHPQPLSPGGEGSVLLVHLGMTGQFTVAPAADPLATHTHFTFDLDDGNQLRYRDARRFGSVEWFPPGTDVEAHLGEKLGPEPFGLPAQPFRDAVRASKRTLKAILLDQSVVAGVGNIYADESLHRAKLHPETRGADLTDADCDRLRKAIEAVLTRAIDSRGSTIRDYVGGSGLRGGFQTEFAVYGRGGEGCPKCGAEIEVLRVAGRSSHFCPACQPR
ncbi:MAG: bifunctional DNA-formamidopyrimidine glycosylase/DNA-(apurinic or apyrimidinic site) lyase [Gemmataceae bacterium]